MPGTVLLGFQGLLQAAPSPSALSLLWLLLPRWQRLLQEELSGWASVSSPKDAEG